MKKQKDILFYIVYIGGFSLLIFFLLHQGHALEAARGITAKAGSSIPAWNNFTTAISHSFASPLSLLLLQIITILITARLLATLCRKIGQPAVMGEIIAGIMLGPSLLGTYFPGISHSLFPASSLGNLGIMSQIGLILFMFVVGMELDLRVLKNKAHEAVVISHASIICPFALGIGLAYFIYQHTAPPQVNFLSYALFIGVSMSITAFPVLARILQERGMSRTRLGALTITCAAADDITAWCILAAVVAIVKAGALTSAVYTILLSAIYVLVMVKVVRPLLSRMGQTQQQKLYLNQAIIAISFLTLLVSAWCTEVIGIHALFGAFMAGVIMPDSMNFRRLFREKVEDLAMTLLLPLFFVFTGLRTQIGLLNTAQHWLYCLLFISIAVTGKFAGSALAARFVGQNWKNSLTIGALMNTRGLMELVALNIGYDLGVLSPQVFTMLVIMALVTTFMTGPSLNLINRLFKGVDAEEQVQPIAEEEQR